MNIFQDLLTLEYQQEKLSRYSVEWQPDEQYLARVGNPRLFHHPSHSAQPELWEPGEVEWFVIIPHIPPRAGANSLIACWSCTFPCCPTARKALL